MIRNLFINVFKSNSKHIIIHYPSGQKKNRFRKSVKEICDRQ